MQHSAPKNDSVRLFQSVDHPCGYFGERTARNLVLDPVAPELPLVYGRALEHGFRRAGGHVYRPNCQGCSACVASRIPVADFTPDRSQQRCWRRNADLRCEIGPPDYSERHFDLYQRYLQSRHAGGGMDQASAEDFSRFLQCPWSDTRFLSIYQDDRLLACAVTDLCRIGASAVYTFFDPDAAGRSLGIYAILQQIELCRRHGLPHLYLGYWIAGHPKMDYKQRFRPLQVLCDGHWRVQSGPTVRSGHERAK